jgi:hypothetical protein
MVDVTRTLPSKLTPYWEDGERNFCSEIEYSIRAFPGHQYCQVNAGIKVKVKGKVRPRTDNEGPEGGVEV